MLLVATAVSNIFYLSYLLFIVLEKNILYPHFTAFEKGGDTVQILHFF